MLVTVEDIVAPGLHLRHQVQGQNKEDKRFYLLSKLLRGLLCPDRVFLRSHYSFFLQVNSFYPFLGVVEPLCPFS